MTDLPNLGHNPFLLSKISQNVVPVGICLLDWSTWRRLPKMRLIDAAGFLSTAIAVLVVNAVAAMAIGSSLYAIRYAYVRYRTTPPPPLQPR